MNCWEFMQCGREDGGKKTDEFGICPSYPDKGKTCARVTGTFFNGRVQGTFATKLGTCKDCDYYNSEHYNRDYLKARFQKVGDY
ncbi:MAG: hypothetical protein KAR83_06160 [Thermodesulfovibrionales bacterium]|nr:hypothetical protein [Thermodesulfovibrionales bacterium]